MVNTGTESTDINPLKVGLQSGELCPNLHMYKLTCGVNKSTPYSETIKENTNVSLGQAFSYYFER